MNNSLVDFACFLEKTDDFFHSEFFKELNKEINFSCGVLFYKKGAKYNIQYQFINDIEFKNYIPNLKKEANLYKLKIPIKAKDCNIGCVLLIKKNQFLQTERKKIKDLEKKCSEKIKDFEFSKIFKSQLVILQKAILEKNNAQKKLTEQNEKLIETDKAKSEFLANVSHELRTPLNSIIGFATALKDEMQGPLNNAQKSFANKILSSAIHLTGLINDILDITKIEAKGMKLNIRPYSPGFIIKEVVNITEPLAEEKNIKIEVNIKSNGKILIDCTKFRQILYNLIGNAIKFSHNNSKIKVSLYKNKFSEIIIKIRDFGIGIDKKNQKIIFEKFVQLDNIYTKKYSSTGLGLTITLELLKLMNGKISLKSNINKGSEFTLKFEEYTS